MRAVSFLPRVSAFDPVLRSEGSIDPLGLVPIADRLSVKLVPGMRERMKHPRYLSLLTIGCSICRDFGTERMATDGITPPIQVYEWYVVQALVKELTGKGLVGLPGSEKAFSAMKKDLPLNASRYLRVPSVFGFYGVYKTLARDMHLLQGDELDEAAEELLKIYESEQKLPGLHSTSLGAGRTFRDQLKRAVEDGLNAACVDRKWNWYYNETIAKYMHPAQPGPKEAECLFRLTKHDTNTMRSEIIDGLMAYTKTYEWKKGVEESHFHRFLLDKVRAEIRQLLDAILVYEQFSRVLTNAFEAMLHKVTAHGFRSKMTELAELSEVSYASERIPELFQECTENLKYTAEDGAFHRTFSRFMDRSTSLEFVERILDHHKFIQVQKPPAGKALWIERMHGEQLMLRPTYGRQESLVNTDLNAYVYMYRTNSLTSFLADLKKI